MRRDFFARHSARVAGARQGSRLHSVRKVTLQLAGTAHTTPSSAPRLPKTNNIVSVVQGNSKQGGFTQSDEEDCATSHVSVSAHLVPATLTNT